MLVINLCIAVFVIGSAIALIAQRDLWPFSPYPMFAALQQPELDILDVVGITANGSEEIPLAPSRRTSLVAGTRFRTLLDRLTKSGSEPELRSYLASLAQRYAADDAEDRAPLKLVRLYRTRWHTAPEQQPPAQQIDRRLLAELDLSR
jgi:hypothetical protein